MNYTGRGATPGTTRYFCLGCAPNWRYKELFDAVVQNTGARGFSFLFIPTLGHMGSIRFDNAALKDGPVVPGQRVLALFGAGQTIDAVYRNGEQAMRRQVPPPTPYSHPNERTMRHPSRQPIPYNRSAGVRVWGYVELISATHGKVREANTGIRYHLHVTNTNGMVMRNGQRVTFTPGQNQQGPIALNVMAN